MVETTSTPDKGKDQAESMSPKVVDEAGEPSPELVSPDKIAKPKSAFSGGYSIKGFKSG